MSKDEPETLMICYDNLDAIEDNLELRNFDDVLIAVKENMNAYLFSTQDNFSSNELETPHFVYIATFRKITAVKAGLSHYEEESKKNAG